MRCLIRALLEVACAPLAQKVGAGRIEHNFAVSKCYAKLLARSLPRKWAQGGSKITLPHQSASGSCLRPLCQKVGAGWTENDFASSGSYRKLLAHPLRKKMQGGSKKLCPIRVLLNIACIPLPRKWEQGRWKTTFLHRGVI